MSHDSETIGGRVLTPQERTVERGRGCWNCTAWDNDDKARSLWSELRQRDLKTALAVSMSDVRGEDHPHVMQIRRMVDAVDRSMATGSIGICLRGKAGTDLCFAGFLCNHWNGRVGSSLATNGKPLDLLPEELMEKLDSGLADSDQSVITKTRSDK